jgi:hypothetical protein
VLLLALASILIASCAPGSAGSSPNAASTTPTPTLTFNFKDSISPTPTLAPYYCGAWVTFSTPTYSGNGMVPIYAKFTLNQDGNPQGIVGATATYTIQWGDGTTEVRTASTDASGLATTYAPMGPHYGAVNRLTLITVNFSGGGHNCSVGADRPASFALSVGSTQKQK